MNRRSSSRRPNAHTRPSKSGGNSLRIIGGQWRGRKLGIVDIDGLRPTGDRIRETLFNWLAPQVPGAHCLDLFAGSGALGLEALSRGAETVTLIERDRAAANQLRQHATTLEAAGARILEADALTWLEAQQSLPVSQKPEVHIAFLDPPFAANLWQLAAERLENSGLLADDAAIYIESPINNPVTPPPNWALHREKRSGKVDYRLYYRQG